MFDDEIASKKQHLSEIAVIGSLLRDNKCFDEINGLPVSDFYSPSNQIIYKEIMRILENGKPVDMIIIGENLESTGDLKKVGGMEYLSDAVSSINTTKNFKYHADIIRVNAIRREMQKISAMIGHKIQDGTPPETVREFAEKEMHAIFENVEHEDFIPAATIVADAVDWLDSNRTTVKTGLRDLDQLTGGLTKGNLIIIAGRPSSGKSSLGMQIAEHVANTEPVKIFSMEMTGIEIGARMLNYHASVVGQSEAVRHISNLQFNVDPSSAITLSHIRAKCREMKRKAGLSLIVVDYLQLMRGEGENRNQEIGFLSRGLKNIAKDFDIPVIALSQLSRKVEERVDKRPLMSDLRDSGEIEQDADMVIFVYREDMYHQGTPLEGMAEIICRKNRNGGVGDIQTCWNGPLTRFLDYDGERVQRLNVVRERKKNDLFY